MKNSYFENLSQWWEVGNAQIRCFLGGGELLVLSVLYLQFFITDYSNNRKTVKDILQLEKLLMGNPGSVQQGRAVTFGGAGAQSLKGAHRTRLLIGLCSLLICVSKWMLLY